MQHRCTKMHTLSFPGTRELVETHFAVALSAGMLAAEWLSRRLQRRTDARSRPPNRLLLFDDYRAVLTSREQKIREAIPSAAGDRLALLKAELAAVEDRLANLAEAFFVLKSELAQAGSALASILCDASRSEIIGARKALDSGDTRPAELIFARVAASAIEIPRTAEAHYRLGRLALANIDYGKGLSHLRQASELAPHDLRVNASLAELVDIVVTLVDAEPLPPATLTVLEELLLVQDRPAVAEQLYQRALRFNERACGPDHPRTVGSLRSLARLYRRQQRYEEAEMLYERALTIAEGTSGPSHPEVAVILEKLAGVYNEQEKHEHVWRSFRRILMIKEAAFGPDHPDVVDAVYNLARSSCRVGRLSDAELLYRRLLSARERMLGPDHLNVANILNKLAGICDLAGNYHESEMFYRRTLSIRERALPTDHPLCADTLRSLADVCRKQGKDWLAEQLYRHAKAVSERAFGIDHSRTTRTPEILESLHVAGGEYRRAGQM